MEKVSAKELIGKGYFPKEIPEIFSTDKLSKIMNQIDFTIFNKHDNKKWSKTLNISIPKLAHARRILNVPTPFHQIKLSEYIESEAANLNDFFKQSKFSLTTPVIKENSKRAVDRKYDFSEIVTRRIYGTSDKKYVLKTDLSRYFPTIYTHSIPWALHTKSTAKLNIKDKDLTGNKIDELIRNMQDGQTFGLPVGPDTSLIISEIIGTAIDIQLQELYPDLEGGRYTDDFEFYFKTFSDAEKVLNSLQKIVRDFELDLNPSKTEIITCPDMLEPIWLSNLKLYHFRNNSQNSQKNDIVTFFSRAFEFQKKFPFQGVLKYSLQKIKNVKILPDNWSILESLLLHSMLIDSSTISIIQDIFYGYKEKGYTINKEKIQSTIGEIINSNISIGNHYEVIWALSMSTKLKLTINEDIGKLLFNFEDSFSNILTMESYINGNIKGNHDLDYYQSLLNDNELYGRNWLFAYEMGIKDWLKPKENMNYIKEDKFYNQLVENNVEFYNLIDEQIEDIDDDWLTAILAEEDFFNSTNPSEGEGYFLGLKDY
ncbi:RNA-directed DNA polymerase [Peribacillus sp. NPDC096448]|uniref:RNA-directed DNA polymerase n=1 Tax=Peribacillus sp. NPDC096448 TaxID=3364395 RepID=UPI00381D40F9